MKNTLLLICLSVSCYIQAQTSGLIFEGANRTNLSWLANLSSINDSTAIMKSLQNTGLFQQVNSRRENDTIVFELVEKNYFVPLIGFNFSKDHQNYYYAGLSDFNLFGRGINLYTAAEWFGKFSGEIYIDASRNFRFRHGPIFNYKIVNTLEPIYFNQMGYDYHYQNNLFKLGYAYWIKPTWQLGLTTSFFQEQYRYVGLEEIGLPEIDKVNKGSLELFANWQNLNYHYHNLEGVRFFGSYEYTLDLLDRFNFQKAYFTAQRYWMPAEKSMLASQFRFGYSSFNDSPFPAFFVDDFENVRGVGDRIARGSSESTVNIEWRQTLWQTSFLYVQLVPFVDYTCVLPSDYKLNPDPIWNHDYIRLGAGARIGTYHFFNACFRIDATIDPENKKFTGFVLGVGQYF